MSTTSSTQSGADYIQSLIADLQSLDHAAAVKRLIDTAREYPNDARPLFLLAGEYAQARQYDLAEAAFISSLRIAPNFAPACFQLGLLQFTSGRPAAASATWDGLNSLPENHAYRLFKAGFEALAVDNFSEADRLIRLGMQANTTNAPLNKDMQMVLTSMPKPAEPGSLPAQLRIAEADKEAAGEETTEHFLMSAYRNLH